MKIVTDFKLAQRWPIFASFGLSIALSAVSFATQAQKVISEDQIDAIRGVEIAFVSDEVLFQRQLLGPEIFKIGCVYRILDQTVATLIVREANSMMQLSENGRFQPRYAFKIFDERGERSFYFSRHPGSDGRLAGRFDGGSISAGIDLLGVLRDRAFAYEATLKGTACIK